MTLTVLAYTGDSLILEEDISTGCEDFAAIANGLRARLPECNRVVVLRDGTFAYDTNDHRH